MAGRSIVMSTSSAGKTAKRRENASATEKTRKRVVPTAGKPAAKTPETHRGSATDVLSAFAELYRQL
jgi:hypothetical protein